MDARPTPSPAKCALRVSGDPAASLLGGGTVERRVGHLRQRPAHPLPRLQRHLPVARSRPTPATTSPPCWPSARRSGPSGKRPDHRRRPGLRDPVPALRRRQPPQARRRSRHLRGDLVGRRGLQADEPRRDEDRRTRSGIAGVCNVALRQTRSGELSMWKGCAFANAARNGVFAAMLAAEGLTGPAPIFEGDLGFMKLVTREPFDRRPARRRAGQRRRVHDQQDLHQVLAGRVPLAERHRRRPAAPRRNSAATCRRSRAIDIHTFEAPLQHHRQVPGGVGAEDPRDGRPQPALLHRRRPAWTAT